MPSNEKTEDRLVFFLSIIVTEEVYVRPDGWTRALFKFAFARDDNEAETLARRYCAENKLTVAWVRVSRAREQNLARYLNPETMLRSRELAPVWRGEVSVHPDQISVLTGLGATCERELGGHQFVFSAPESTAMLINASNAIYIGMLKPLVAASNDASATAPTGAGL